MIKSLLGTLALSDSIWNILLVALIIVLVIGFVKKLTRLFKSVIGVALVLVLMLNIGRIYIKNSAGIDIGDKQISIDINDKEYTINIDDINKIVLKQSNDKVKVTVRTKKGVNPSFNVSSTEAFALECIARSKGIKISDNRK